MIISLRQPGDLKVVVVPSRIGTTYLEDESETRSHAEGFNHLRAAALTESESQTKIRGLLSGT
jgi:hypothetical protein